MDSIFDQYVQPEGSDTTVTQKKPAGSSSSIFDQYVQQDSTAPEATEAATTTPQQSSSIFDQYVAPSASSTPQVATSTSAVQPQQQTAQQVPQAQSVAQGPQQQPTQTTSSTLDEPTGNEVNKQIEASLPKSSIGPASSVSTTPNQPWSLKDYDLIGKAWNELTQKKSTDEIAAAYIAAKVNKNSAPDKQVTYNQVFDNLPAYKDALGISRPQTLKEKAETLGVFGLAAVPLAPVAAVVGAGIFGGIHWAVNKIVPGGLSTLLPSGSGPGAHDLADALQIVGEATLAHFAEKGGSAAGENIIPKITKQNIIEGGLPKTITLDPTKVRDVYQTGKLMSPEESEMYRKVVGSQGAAVVKQAIKNGVTIEVPTEKIVTQIDQPWWGKLKQALGGEASEPIVNRETTPGSYKIGGQAPTAPQEPAFGGLLSEKAGAPSVFDQYVKPQPEMQSKPLQNETDQPIPKQLYHGTENGQLKVDNFGNVNLAAHPEDAARFGPVSKISTAGLSIEHLPSEVDVLNAVSNPQIRQQYLDQGVHVLSSGNLNISIDPGALSKSTGIPLRAQSPRSRTIEDMIKQNNSIESNTEKQNSIVYHGTKANISGIKSLHPIEYGDPQALYGPGVYLTDNASIASGYAKTKGTGANGKVHAGELKHGLKFLDLDKPLGENESKIIKDFINAEHGNLSAGNENIDGMTGAQAVQKLRSILSEAHIPKYEAADVFYSLQQKLSEELGYDGFKHIGGVGAGMPHNVKILFDYGDVQNTPASKISKEFPQEENGGTVLHSELIPGLAKAVTEDVIPKAQGLYGGTRQFMREAAALINPTGAAPSAGLDIIMRHKGAREQGMFRTERLTQKINAMWDKQPMEARLEFMAKIEAGEEVPKEYKDIADFYRQRLDKAFTDVAQFRNINFLQNFFPHFWKRPGEVEANLGPIIFGRRPLEGSKSFLKSRVFSSIQEGIKAGYTPVSTNPEELMQLYEANVAKFVMAQRIKADMIDSKLWKFVRRGERPPDGFARIDDSIARVYFPKEIAKVVYEKPSGEVATGDQLVEAGEYFVQKDVARLINNFLSKDYIMDTVAGRGIMAVKNTMNAAQLSFSAFHLTTETLNAIISRLGLGASEILAGHPITGGKKVLGALTAPIDYAIVGQKFFNLDPSLAQLEKDIFIGGASLRNKQYYKNTVFENFIKNVREGNYASAVVRAPFAVAESIMRPLFSWYIPRLKVAAFQELFASELQSQSAEMQAGKITRETIARQTWNNIENRFGLINYDNLFWDHNFKTAMMLSFRAVGWNLGTGRELGGAILQDLPQQLLEFTGVKNFKMSRQELIEAVKNNQWEKIGEDLHESIKSGRFRMTPKMQYTFGLFLLVGSVGALYQYLHTGKRPQSLLDYFYPKDGTLDRNGDWVRRELPTYLKDLYQSSHHPLVTASNKMAPEFSTLVDLLKDRDFFNNLIYNKNDPASTQLTQIGKYLGEQFLPFTISQVQQQNKANTPTEQRVESFFGIMKAPSDVIASPETQERQKVLDSRYGAGAPKTPEQQEQYQQKAALLKEYVDKAKATNDPYQTLKIQNDYVKEVLGHAPESATERRQATLLIDKFKQATIKQTGNHILDSVLGAPTNDMKVKLLQNYRSKVSPQEFNQTLNTLLQKKGITKDVRSRVYLNR